nr:MAG TPA: hypothetical protein [Caudoviricetes sp.]
MKHKQISPSPRRQPILLFARRANQGKREEK